MDAPTFFRIDEWNAQGNSSHVYFEENLTEALKYVSSMRQITDTEGVDHTSIQPFIAETCDMDGWNNSDANETTPVNYAY